MKFTLLLFIIMLTSCTFKNVLDIPKKMSVTQCIDIGNGYICRITFLKKDKHQIINTKGSSIKEGLKILKNREIDLCYLEIGPNSSAISCEKYELIKKYAMED